MRDDAPETHYNVLGVTWTASMDEIKAAHRQRAKELHPDKAPNREQEFMRVQNAWECLREHDRRKAYDNDLLHQKMIRKSKVQAAMHVKLSEMEQGEDDEGQICFIYQCRCGDQIEIWQDTLQCQEESVLFECPSCSFSYTLDTKKNQTFLTCT